MKNVAIICAALLVVGMVATASAGENTISKSTLASMGFASASPMSDVDGLGVRGKGWSGPRYGTSASVGGTSAASFFDVTTGVSTASNNYAASSLHKWGISLAKGNDSSNAGIITPLGSISVVSGGSAFAFSK